MDAVEIVRLSFRYLHLLGMAVLVGSLAVEILTRRFVANRGIAVGGMLVIATGLVLAAPWPRDAQPDPAKLAVKLLLAIAAAVVSIIAERRGGEQKPLLMIASGLALLIVGVAVFWN